MVMPPKPRSTIKADRSLSSSIFPNTMRISANPPLVRSEEHTSELQSLMRISYAVFCLKKKKNSYDTDNSPLLIIHYKNCKYDYAVYETDHMSLGMLSVLFPHHYKH